MANPVGEEKGTALPCIAVFTDLDGTLLDHETYSWAPAAPALDRLRTRNIPLIIASSKTAAEIEQLRDAIGFGHMPAIVENGAGILEGGATAGSDRVYHDRIMWVLSQIPGALRRDFEGFTDWGIEGISRETGLSKSGARLAHARQFSEPGLWRGSEQAEAEFIAVLAEHGVHARRGGRFLTLSFGATKADRMRELSARFAPCRTIALGDAPNDVEMLQAASLGVVVKNPHAAPLPPLVGEADGRIIRTKLVGPAGWNEAVLKYVEIWNPELNRKQQEV
ncbi:hypothetical protein B9057_13125 [Aestuarium zhoushanense]|nr:hypothetical protein B9057_13125 [Aestuarium zhoushanense]